MLVSKLRFNSRAWDHSILGLVAVDKRAFGKGGE
jgi:hypothetical protein